MNIPIGSGLGNSGQIARELAQPVIRPDTDTDLRKGLSDLARRRQLDTLQNPEALMDQDESAELFGYTDPEDLL